MTEPTEQNNESEDFSVIVIAGPGGVGKGTVVAEILKADPRLWLSRSWTTRARRVGEPKDNYFFKSPEEFEAHIASGGFLEWAHFLDYMQGSPIPEPPSGTDVVFEIDVQGAEQIKGLYPRSLLIFLDAPSREEQARRMTVRGDATERIEQRLRKAEEELERSKQLDFVHLINDELDSTVAEVLELIAAHRSATSGLQGH